ncbi:MAG: transporter ATP-binding protein [Microbacteriaceae bacterium]|nr:transporter ATP-binding protein [Microbacteriaceae bacterium]
MTIMGMPGPQGAAHTNALAGYQDVIDKLTDGEPAPEPVTGFSQRSPVEPRISLLGLISRYPKLLIAASLSVIGFSIAQQAGPFLIQIAINDGMIGGKPWIIVWTAAAFGVTVVLTVLFQRWQTKSTGWLAASALRGLRIRVFSHLERLSMDFYSREKTGVIITRMTSDIETLQLFLQDGAAQLVVQLLTMIVIAGALVAIDPMLGLITLAVVIPPLLGLSLWYRHRSTTAFTRVRDGVAGVNSHLAESLSGVKVVTSHNRQDSNVIMHRGVTDIYRRANLTTAWLNAIYGPGTLFLGYLVQAGVLVVAGVMVIRGELAIGGLVAYFLYLNRFFAPILLLVAQYSVMQQAQSSITKLRELLAQQPSVLEAEHPVALPPITGEIELKGVSFGYAADRPVISDISLKIEPGERIAFVGPTGAGKSTIAKLVSRFYDPTSGSVLIDGIDVRTVSFESLREQIGSVPQEAYLFTGTLRDNLAFGEPDAGEERILAAVDAVGLRHVVDAMPAGLDTIVHERGQSLSSGERQLVALARAFLADPRILVLDEATSNLDLTSEAAVEKGLEQLLIGRTSVIIAHRLSTAMKADRIVVIDQGRVAEVGSHKQLLELGGLYAAMFETWARES